MQSRMLNNKKRSPDNIRSSFLIKLCLAYFTGAGGGGGVCPAG